MPCDAVGTDFESVPVSPIFFGPNLAREPFTLIRTTVRVPSVKITFFKTSFACNESAIPKFRPRDLGSTSFCVPSHANAARSSC